MKKGHLLDGFHFSPRTFGEKSADVLSRGAGSWAFIILFFIFIGFWMVTNGYFLLKYIGDGTFNDLYPFILLNLVLSCLAAIQAPVILMSQNRQSKVDRQRFDYDYSVNRKSERKIEEMQKQLERIERKILGKKIPLKKDREKVPGKKK